MKRRAQGEYRQPSNKADASIYAVEKKFREARARGWEYKYYERQPRITWGKSRREEMLEELEEKIRLESKTDGGAQSENS